ncbi:MFS transporter [Phycicoccus sp. MQZ13P-5]|uniref:MFS transporter n=2 Tax=Phycicoccus sonneratiae TaxID=2807628 RepID=A0ABS2CJ09_9MICO|nr:MFS transporter [Phycicoccus sonneraticus]
MSAAAPTLDLPRVRTARTAVFVVFALAGLVFASWAARIADTKVALGLSAGELGATLLAASVGSVTGLPLAGRVSGRLGASRTVGLGAVVSLVGLLATGAVVDAHGSRYLVMVGLFLVGLGVGLWDVSMNLEGAAVERELGSSVMPHFHAAFSGGTVLSALVGAGMSAAHVPLLLHFGGAVLVTVAGAAWALPRFLPRGVEAEEEAAESATGERRRSAWLEPRTLLIGVVVLAAAFTEGTANDWLAVAFVEGHELPTWAGVLGFATFLTFMTVGRLLGTRLLDRHGREPVLRVSFGLAVVGALLVVFGADWLAFAGAAVWGVGAALGFPVGMSASADDPQRAAARMSVVATIGYVAFIAGPPLLGFLGDHVGVLHALLVVGALAILALSVVTSVREPDGRPAGAARTPDPAAGSPLG